MDKHEIPHPPVQSPSMLKKFLVDFVAGAAGGTACVYSGQPFDTIKVKMQTFPTLYKGPYDCFRNIIKSEGVKGLYKGATPALLCSVAENSVLFVALGFGKNLVSKLVGKKESELSIVQNASAGSFAGIFSAMVVCPTELIKCRMQAMKELASKETSINKNIGPWTVARDIVRQKGITAMFQGLTSTWIRDLSGYFLFFLGYELTKSLLVPKGKTQDDIGPLGLMFAGGTAGAFLWIAVFPLDAVKSRIQVLSMTGKQQGFIKTFSNVVKHEGIGRLYSGLAPCILRTYPANGALFLVYEWTRKKLHALNLD